jgi:hypothetical protein
LASASRFDSRASLATWLHRITVNCAPDRLRVLGREAADPAALAGQSAWAPLPPDLAAQQACRPHAQLRGRPASPKVSLNLADVSDDNLPAKIESPWSVPFPDDAIRSMDKRCLAAVGDARGPSSRAIHVRLPAVKNASKSRWSEPAALVMRDSR